MVKSVLRRVRDTLRQLAGASSSKSSHAAESKRALRTEQPSAGSSHKEEYQPRSRTAHRDAAPERRHEAHPHPRGDRAPQEAEAGAAQDDQELAPRRRRRRRGGRGRRRAQPVGTVQDDTTSAEPQAEAAPEPWDPASYVVPEAEGKTRFRDLDLPTEILHAVADLGFQYCTPIQAAILPTTLNGQDAYGKAQTGTGKSAAFLITILAHLLRKPIPGDRKSGTPRALIIAPTRELALQIEKDARALSAYTPAGIVAVYGGMDYDKQRKALQGHPVDIVIATPGRLLDFKSRHDLHLGKVEILVIDEADRMLDMGFIPDVRNIIHSTPPRHNRQTLLFSATLTPDVIRLASQWTQNPATVEIEPEQVAVDTVEQLVYIVTAREKFPLLYNLITQQDLKRVMVFVNRRDEVRRLTEALQDHGIDCEMLTGDVPQKKRLQTLEAFREGKMRVMVATDVAGRGIHIEGVSHVVNFTLPHDPEDYVHRIGRTGRAGASGISVSFASETDSFHIPDIEAFIGRDLKCTHPDEALLKPPPPARPRRRSPEGEERPHRPSHGRDRRPRRR